MPGENMQYESHSGCKLKQTMFGKSRQIFTLALCWFVQSMTALIAMY